MQSYALAVGQSIFADNCAPCHGPGGTGGKGYPNLRDDVWLWGGSLEDIQRTITYGVRSGDPKRAHVADAWFGADAILKPDQIDDLTEFVSRCRTGRPTSPPCAAPAPCSRPTAPSVTGRPARATRRSARRT